MSSRFGYSPDKAERVNNQLDRDLGFIRHYSQRVEGAVPGTPLADDKVRQGLELIEEAVSDKQEEVRKLTDSPSEAVAPW